MCCSYYSYNNHVWQISIIVFAIKSQLIFGDLILFSKQEIFGGGLRLPASM